MQPMETFDERETAESAAEFVLDTEEKVNWLLRKLANLEAEKARVKAQAEALLSQIQCDIDGLHWRFQDDLRDYAAKRLAESGGRRKSVTLLQGTLAFRVVPARWKVVDPSAALEWAKTTGAATCIRLREELDSAKVLEIAEATGELLPGVDHEPERESFSIRFGKAHE